MPASWVLIRISVYPCWYVFFRSLKLRSSRSSPFSLLVLFFHILATTRSRVYLGFPVLSMLHCLVSLLILPTLFGSANAAVTVYGVGGAQNPTGSQSGSLPVSTLGSTEWTSALGAWNNVQLQAPPLPVPLPPTAFTVALANQAQHVTNLSIPQRGDFYGFSIEMSVVEQVSKWSRPICEADG